MTHLPLNHYTVSWLKGSETVNDEVLADHCTIAEGAVTFTKRGGSIVAIYTVPVRVWKEVS